MMDADELRDDMDMMDDPELQAMADEAAPDGQL